MFFNSIKEINRFRKKKNRLLSKGMSNIYVKVTIEKNLSPGQFWGALITRISLNLKTFCCNLKIRGLQAKLCLGFLLYWFWKELRRLKVKESVHFVEQKYKL